MTPISCRFKGIFVDLPLLQMIVYALNFLSPYTHRAIKWIILRAYEAILDQTSAFHNWFPIILADFFSNKTSSTLAHKSNLAFSDHLGESCLSNQRISRSILWLIPVSCCCFLQVLPIIFVKHLRNWSSLLHEAHLFLVKLAVRMVGPKLILVSIVAKHDLFVGLFRIQRHLLVFNLILSFVGSLHSIDLLVKGRVSVRPRSSALLQCTFITNLLLWAVVEGWVRLVLSFGLQKVMPVAVLRSIYVSGCSHFILIAFVHERWGLFLQNGLEVCARFRVFRSSSTAAIFFLCLLILILELFFSRSVFSFPSSKFAEHNFVLLRRVFKVGRSWQVAKVDLRIQ